MDWKALAAQKGRHFLPIVPISESYYRAHFHCHLVKAHFAGSLRPSLCIADRLFLQWLIRWILRGSREQEDISHWPSFCLAVFLSDILPSVILSSASCGIVSMTMFSQSNWKVPLNSFARATFVLDIHSAVSLFSTSSYHDEFRVKWWPITKATSSNVSDHYLHSMRARDSNLSGKIKQATTENWVC